MEVKTILPLLVAISLTLLFVGGCIGKLPSMPGQGKKVKIDLTSGYDVSYKNIGRFLKRALSLEATQPRLSYDVPMIPLSIVPGTTKTFYLWLQSDINLKGVSAVPLYTADVGFNLDEINGYLAAAGSELRAGVPEGPITFSVTFNSDTAGLTIGLDFSKETNFWRAFVIGKNNREIDRFLQTSLVQSVYSQLITYPRTGIGPVRVVLQDLPVYRDRIILERYTRDEITLRIPIRIANGLSRDGTIDSVTINVEIIPAVDIESLEFELGGVSASCDASTKSCTIDSAINLEPQSDYAATGYIKIVFNSDQKKDILNNQYKSILVAIRGSYTYSGEIDLFSIYTQRIE